MNWKKQTFSYPQAKAAEAAAAQLHRKVYSTIRSATSVLLSVVGKLKRFFKRSVHTGRFFVHNSKGLCSAPFYQYSTFMLSTLYVSLNSFSSLGERISITSVKCPSCLSRKPATFSPVQIELRITAYCFSGSYGSASKRPPEL